ncbi:MAG: TetR family transcriptional regulator C-terminal domain-containing protein [Scytonema sp. PMC 1069.18]|nr:TetR family transcriptional regulator C-terminal domain-containing protein [Scytonema sp. PMC 1069.18]MEC4882899.1 TetR family transcriptional regulator C-terminal domain-containing protein [Scytonema sp. PMC 1070.18]
MVIIIKKLTGRLRISILVIESQINLFVRSALICSLVLVMPKENVREKLIEAGLKVFWSRGFNAAGIKELVETAGVPKGSFYHYFDSKEAFAQAVVERYACSSKEMHSQILHNRSLSPLTRLRHYFEALTIDYEQMAFAKGCFLGNLSLELADHSTSVCQCLETAFSGWEEVITQVLVEAVDCGELSPETDIASLAAFCVNSWEGALVRMKAARNAQPLQVFLSIIFNQILTRKQS